MGAVYGSDDEREALTAAERCGMCADTRLANEPSALVAATGTSCVRLARNQHPAEYSLVIFENR